MSFRVKNSLLGIATLGILLLSIGCPNSTPVSGGNGQLLLDVQFVNTATRWDASFIIDQIFIRPSDPTVAGIIETGRELALIQLPLFVSSFDPTIDPGFYLPVTLAQGSYDIAGIRITDSFYFDADFDTSGATTCIDAQLFLAPTNNPNIDIVNFNPQPVINVVPDSDTVLGITIDLGAFISAFEAAWDCNGGVGGTATNFKPNQFADANASYLTIQ